MPSSQGYSKVASEPPIDPVDGTVSMPAGGNASSVAAATAMMSTVPSGGGVGVGGIQSNPGGKIPATNSQQRLMPADSDSVSSSMDEGELRVPRGNPLDEDTDTATTTTTTMSASSGANAWFTVIVLCFVNLINYMDRFTIAGKSE
uniref:Major facilitator superfamily (MFS) profile domain-containing protein n=1 Tax=Anopheles minimus TaxID=112268 RepID=A0A182WCD5_9DIPT